MVSKEFLFLFCFMLLVCSCSKNSDFDLSKTIMFGEEAEISIPENILHNPLQGHDSAFGKFTDPEDSTFVLFYDIGGNAGNYVDLDASDISKGKSTNATFYYQEVEKSYINDPDCCLYITFPDVGPANFISLKNHHMDLVLEIMETFTTK